MPLTPADIVALSRLLDEGLALDASEREAWLAALPAEDQHHASRLREMLLDEAGLGTDERLSTLPKLGADDEVAHEGELVGPYRLLHEIGRGGMGSVWLAERADGSFKRQVALKLPRLAWGAGLADRMAREREIGMLLEHPNIARLYDAGVDDHGRPYIALEYIVGEPIDAWCRARQLPVRERLGCIVQVARAVSYAHGRLVVHRDLKPSNVLVTGDGQTHLLDFGIAKLLNEGSENVGLTRDQGRVLTPHYASPEQLRGETITVASDVYSLGVLSYELLSGSTPYTPKRKTLAALEEAVLEGEPTLASSRTADPAAARALKGEVDSILAKALRRDAAQRYATAEALARDIERHLNGEVVDAQPDSTWYRLGKAVRRHRIGFAAAAAVSIAVIAGTGVAALQWRRANVEAARANDEARRARLEAARAGVVKDFVTDIFKVNSRDAAIKRDLRKLPAELLLERGAAAIDSTFRDQPELQAELYGVVAGIFSDMNNPTTAARYAQRHVDALEAIGAPAPQRADAMLLLARTLLGQDRLADAQKQAQAALTLGATSSPVTVKSRLVLAEIFKQAARYADAKQELDLLEPMLADTATAATIDRANATFLRGELTPAEDLTHGDRVKDPYERAIGLALEAEGPLSRRAVTMRLALVLRLGGFNGTLGVAKQHLAAALASMRAAGGDDDPVAALAEADAMARFYDAHLIAFEEARDAIERSRQRLRRAGNALPSEAVARADLALGRVYLTWGDFERSEALIAAAFPLLWPHAESPFEKRILTVHRGSSLQYVGKYDEADRFLRESLAWRKIDSVRNPFVLVFGYLAVAENLLMANRLAEARVVLDQAAATIATRDDAWFNGVPTRELRIFRAMLAIQSGQPQEATRLTDAFDFTPSVSVEVDEMFTRGLALCSVGRRPEGMAWMDKAIAGRSTNYPDSPELAALRAHTGLCALRSGRRRRAVDLSALASAVLQRQAQMSPYFADPIRRLERELRKP